MRARTTGRLIAAGLLAGVALLVGASMLLAPAAPSPRPRLDPSMPAPPTGGRTVDAPAGGGAVQDLVALGSEGVWTRLDPLTGALEYKLTYQGLDPEEDGVFLLTRPRAWIYQPGRVIEVTADRGRLVWPSRGAGGGSEPPESGRLEGDVLVITRPHEPSEPVDPQPAPILTVRTQALSFHATLGELATDQPVQIDGAGGCLLGTALTMRFTSDRSRPLSLLRIERGGSFIALPGAGQEQAPSDARPGAGDSPVQTDEQPRLDHYEARISGGAIVQTAGRRLEGEVVELWARLENGRLREGAVARFEPNAADADAAPEPPSSAPDAIALRPASSAQGPGDGASVICGPPDPIVTLAWSGAFEIRPLAEAPSELEQDDVYARAHSPSGGSVRTVDAATGASLRSLRLDYGATTRRLGILGLPPVGVSVLLPGIADLTTGRVDLDLTRGLVSLPSAGVLTALSATPGAPSPDRDDSLDPPNLSWQERADLRLDVSDGPVGSTGAITPIDAIFSGDAEARHGESRLSADALRAVFASAPGASSSGSGPLGAAISRLFATGNARARDARGGRVSADELQVRFSTPRGGDRAVPVLATATGAARAEREGQSLRAQFIEATLRQDEAGDTIAAALEARVGVEVRVERRAGDGAADDAADEDVVVELLADRLTSSIDTGVIETSGLPAVASRLSRSTHSSISARAIRASTRADDRTVTAFGPGFAEHVVLQPEPGAPDTVRAEWRGGMVYDDARGRAEAMGGAAVIAHIGTLERHVARGQRLIVDLEPPVADDEQPAPVLGAPPDGGGPQPAPAAAAAEGRRLRRAVIEGDLNAPAELELRRYSDPPPGLLTVDPPAGVGERVLESLAFVRAPLIDLDADAGRLSVPDAGLLLLEDRRVPFEPADPLASPPPPGRLGEGAGRGTTVVEWAGALTLDRATGLGQADGGVRIRHRDPASGALSELQARSVSLAVAPDEPTAPPPPFDGVSALTDERPPARFRLLGATATGDVLVFHASLQIAADQVEVDASAQRLVATALPGRLVSVLDSARGQNFSADRIVVNLTTGEWEASGVTPVSIPR